MRLELLILSYNKFFDWVYCVGKVGISHAHKKKQFGCRGLTQTTLHSSLTKKGATMSGVQVRTQDHLRSKVRKKLEPLIEDQRLLNRSLVSEMAEQGYVKLIKKLGADKIIDELRSSEERHENAMRKAKSFFKKASHTSVAYKKGLDYIFSSTTEKKITSLKCEEQCRTWAEKYAEREVQKTEQGKELAKLEALEEACDDVIMEATTQNELTEKLSNLLSQGAGVEWTNYKAIGYKPKAK